MSLGALRPGARQEFLLFGDSLTQRSFEDGGWGASLTHHYARKADIINRGLSGYNSRWAKYILPRVLELRSQPPALLTIWFGANDAVLPDRLKNRQYVPVSEYKSTLEGMVQVAKNVGVQNILLITPPPLDEAARIRWNQQADGVSEATSLPERTNAHTQHRDGQHRVFQLILQSIEAHFAELRVDNLPDDFPHHSLVDEADPKPSIVTW
ncbi:hypothetical protein WJX74_004350 [Apatococcus lobatus]|uniref:SGNH hydrolase-type esterase domain-containing protein n=1 Tax=Apatococcus lobatus TaxID=904363 RepID=A0AAW1RBB0_9CHLO